MEERFVHELPERLSLRDGALAEPLACALRAVDHVHVASGHVALVIGGGPMGLLTAALARRNGAAQVLVSEPSQTRRALASALGVTPVEPANLATIVAELTTGYGVDVCYEAVGLAETLVQSIELTGRGGEIMVLGVPALRQTATLPQRAIFEKELHIAAAWGVETTFGRAIEWLANGDFGCIITHVLLLEDIQEAIATASGGTSGKVMLTPNPGLIP